MSDQLILSGYIVVAWIIHIGLTSLYIHLFETVQSYAFRLTHVAEISVTTSITLFLYGATITNTLPVFETIGVTLTTLIALDFVGLLLLSKLRTLFDPLHFAAAYGAIILATTLIASTT